jgi:hypothetical protein
MLDGFVDSLIQTFENCRPGLSDDALASPTSVEEYLARLYEKEKPRLSEVLRIQYAHLDDAQRQDLFDKIDSRITGVVIPAYARVAGRFTVGERNDFYLTRGAWHGAERLGWSVAGMILGFLAIKSSFIPIWADEWIAVFALAGLVFPELRRVFAWKKYESELNDVVGRTDDEIFRMDVELLTHEDPPLVTRPHADKDAPSDKPQGQKTPRSREGGR